MSKKRRFEVWFKDDPHYMSNVSQKTLNMLIDKKAGITAFKLIRSLSS